MEKVQQDSVIKESILEPPRELDPQFKVDAKGNPISEQEILEQRHLLKTQRKEAAEKAERLARWKGRTPAEIVAMEMERIRPGTGVDETFSVNTRSDGSIDVHLMGRVYQVPRNTIDVSNRGASWHITAQGALDRLRVAAVRPDVAQPVKQSEIYEEQVELLMDLAAAAGLLERKEFQDNLAMIEGLGNSATRWKTQLNLLFLSLRKYIGETRCPTSPPQPQKPKAKAKKAGKKAPSKRMAPGASPLTSLTTPDSPAAEGSPTT